MNRLAGENSPYLRQHADNPVDWYPWGDEAFEVAAATDRPVFISLGYSACHWCHVMAHESFENEETAAILNERFVAVKVDREEHPDVDAVYMEAAQAMNGSGGWPLSIFADANRRPFFAGTYFPDVARTGLPSFTEVLDTVSSAWNERRGEIEQQAGALTEAIANRLEPVKGDDAPPSAISLVRRAVQRFAEIWDGTYGGVGRAPKFPQAPMLELLLRADQMGIPEAQPMLELTLEVMASGGIYDHLGGGFARYSTDRSWTIPHFEKMLYDQAALARLYLHAFLATGDVRWRQVCVETLDYVLSDLALSSGGLASAEDADSEGQEGRFYVWSAHEAVEALEKGGYEGDVAWVLAWYGLDQEPNFERGRSALVRAARGAIYRPLEIEQGRRILRAARAKRVRPGLDEKVLTEWNAMCASVLAEAGIALDEPRFSDKAFEIGKFLLVALRRHDGRWLRSFQRGNAAHLAVASDYGWLVDCFTRLAEASGEAWWLEEAHRTAVDLIRLFGAEDGTFYMTGADAKGLPVRPRDNFDGVLPGASSIAASSLARLGVLLGEDGFIARAQAVVDAAADGLVRAPLALPHLIGAAVQLELGALELVIAGDRRDLLRRVTRRYLPDAVLCWGERTTSPLWTERADGFAYVCRGGVCLTPVNSPDALDAEIDAAIARAR